MSIIHAELSKQGTAMAETALCTEHNTPEKTAAFKTPYDDGTGVRDECPENQALECQVCGAVNEEPGS